MGFLLLGLLPPPTDRPTDRLTDRPPPRSELLLAPPLSFFYTHTRHTHVDSLTHTRQTHTRSLTVPFAHGARAGASLDTHTVDAHTFAHGARARFTLDTHLGASRLVSAGRGSTSGSGRCPSAFRGPPPLMLPGAALGSLAARFCWQGQHFRLWTVPERVSGPPPLMLPGAALGSLAARFCWQGQHFRLWTVPERVSGPPLLMLPGAALGSLAARFCWQGHPGKLCPRDREPPLAWWWSARSLMRVPGSDTGPASIRIRDWEGLSNLGFDHVPGLGRL